MIKAVCGYVYVCVSVPYYILDHPVGSDLFNDALWKTLVSKHLERNDAVIMNREGQENKMSWQILREQSTQ
jgi:hypothetical protein